MKLAFATVGVTMALLLSSSDGCTHESVDNKVQKVVNQQQAIYEKNQPLHQYEFSRERAAIQALYDYRIRDGIDTWTVWLGGGTGEPIDMCPSKGFPLPYTTSMTNPWQVTNGGYAEGTGNVTTGQAEPNGLYPGDTTATWVLCVGDDGRVYPEYVEPDVVTYVSPVKIVEENGHRRIVHIGQPKVSTSINLDPTTPKR